MQLTADTYLQIVESLRSDQAAGGREQRKKPRVGVRGRCTIMITTKSGAKAIAVTVRDLSSEGVGLLLTESVLKKGDEFLLLLPEGTAHGRIAMLCSVRRTAQLSEALFSAGSVIVREIPMDKHPPAAAKPAPAKQTVTDVSKEISADLLAGADTSVVGDVEARLRKLSA